MTENTLRKYCLVIDEWFLLGRKDGDGTKAYKKIYGTTELRSAEVNFSRMLRIAEVKKYIEQKQEENQQMLLQQYNVGIGDIMRELKEVGIDGEWEAKKGMLEGVGIPVKTHEKLTAIAMLMDMIGAKKPAQVDHSGEININAKIEIIGGKS